MGFVDGPKRNGRFIKGKSTLLKGVNLTDFSFAEITEARVQVFDNTHNSVLHVKYHDEDQLKDTIQAHSLLKNDLQPQGRPVIFPRDFTKDWYREKDRIKRRTVRSGDDDDELDLEEEAAQALEAKRRAEARQAMKSIIHGEPVADAESPAQQPSPKPAEISLVTNETQKQKNASTHADKHDVQDAAGPHSLPNAPLAPEFENLRSFNEQKKTIDEVGQLIKGINPAGTETDSTVEGDEGTGGSGFQPMVRPAHVDSGEFEPSVLTGNQPNPPRASSTPQIDAETLAAVKEEAQREGYAEGFKLGEEKASLQTRQTTMQLVGHIQSLLQELVGLKGRVLQSAQNNFVEVVQALAEALLKREFSVNPESLITVINRAIREVVGQDQIKIVVHPATYAVIEGSATKEFLDSIVKDESIAPGDFRIDSKLTTVDGNAAELIKTMLNKADLSLTQDGVRDSGKKVS